jgi:RND superfamily putative drug exporter
VAALLPLGVGLLAVMGGLAGVYLLTRVTAMSEYSLNIVTLIGLGVAIDYSLFIVNRFREELGRGATVEAALARALATAGRAITFSGITVAIGLGGLLFYQGTFLASMGAAGAVVVGCAIFYALTFLPALLALLGPRVNAWRLPLGRPRSGHGFWHTLAHGVMRRPLVVLALTLPVVLAAGAPFVGIRLATADQRALPPQAETHRGVDLLIKAFPGQAQTQISVVVDYPSKGVLSAARVGALYDLSRRIARLPNVLRVEGPVNLAPTLSRAAYQRLYARPEAALPPAARQVVRQSVGPRIAVLTVLTARTATSEGARDLVRAIRSLGRAGDGRIMVTGQTASDVDTVALIVGRTPAAMGFIMVMTYLVLFLLLGSVLLPLKALVTDVLSIMASFGALVWVFQDGHLSKVLNFTPASIDPSVPVLLFCIVFGLSMDYEVLLLSRIKEEYERTGNTRGAVAAGLERSGRLITGAAAIMVVVFLAFGLADTVIIKSIGLGMALAVAVDATLVRALIVPAIMRLLGDLNWWTPRPLAHLHRRLNLGEAGQPIGESAAAVA